MSNCNPPFFPDGLDIEIFSKEVLELANKSCESNSDREHVTPWIRKNNKLKLYNIGSEIDYSKSRWTVDEPEDLQLIRNIVKNFDGRSDFTWLEVLDLEKRKPELFKENAHYMRNEGSVTSNGQKLWRRAKRVIPGGNMLLSKRAEMFLPEKWPAYFSKAKDCYVWDLDDNKLTDMSIMGIGTNLLGYGNAEVDQAVKETVNAGNMSTLNCPEEVLLAEKLIELHPWAEMARFARSGGEANAIAVRIARAATGRDQIAVCGYHGWHDWYIATNLENESGLEEHLLPGLQASGVPKALAGTVHPFSFNRLDQLEEIISENKLGAVKMEVQRSEPPARDFLKE